VPGTVIGALAQPLVVGAVSLVYLAGVIAQAVIGAGSVVERLASLAVAAAIVGVSVHAARVGAFRRRAVLELRREAGFAGHASYGAVVDGRLVETEIALDPPDGRVEAADGHIRGFDALRAITFRLAAADARELKVWTHEVAPNGDSLPLRADVEVAEDGAPPSRAPSGGAVVLPLVARDGRVAGRIEATVRLVRGARTP
jgi:hypothetical protein